MQNTSYLYILMVPESATSEKYYVTYHLVGLEVLYGSYDHN